MKKQIFAILLVLLLMLGGCADQTADPTGKIGHVVLSDKGEKAADAESTNSPLPSESKRPDTPVETKAPESAVPAKSTAALPQKADNQTETTKPSIAPTAPSEGKAPVFENKSAVSKPVAPETPKPTEKPQPTEPPQAPEPSEKPSETPTPTEPPAQSFDVGSYVGYAQSYGQSIGLSLDSTATACWDNPIPASAKSLYIERDLSDLLDWYQASGITAFWVWAEDLGGGSYNIYVGYA